MPFNLLLLPPLGGYWLLRRWNRTRFLLARQDVQRLLLWSATAGLLLLVLAALLAAGGIALGHLAPGVVGSALKTWHLFSPFAHSGKAVLALLLGVGLPFALNRVTSRQWNRPDVWALRATEFYGDETKALLLRAQRNDTPVAVTLRTGKVYVGLSQKNLNAEVERRHLRILPIVSGYRESQTHALRFTTFYEQVREEAKQPDSPFHDVLDRDFEIVVPLAEVTTVSLFDFEAYEAFNRPPPTPAAPDRHPPNAPRRTGKGPPRRRKR